MRAPSSLTTEPRTAGARQRRRVGRRGRPVLVFVACALTAVAVLTGAAVASDDGTTNGGSAGGATQVVTVRDAEGDVIASVPLPAEKFAMRYRNSLYGTLAEERYSVSSDGDFRVIQIAADQLAVLAEYYAIPGRAVRAPATDARTWVADPHPGRPSFTQLSIAASTLGERTLLVPGSRPVELWRLVGSDPIVVMTIEEQP